MAEFKKIPLVVDTQERTHGHEWEFDSDSFTVEYRTLKTADYTVKGLEDQICVERKSLGDAVGTLIGDWPRFRRQLYRMAAYDFPLIVIECDIADIFDHKYESDALPASVLGRINGILIDHAIPVVCWGRRATAIAMVERYLTQLVTKLGEVPQ
jgi:ERCC4-type nuclease